MKKIRIIALISIFALSLSILVGCFDMNPMDSSTTTSTTSTTTPPIIDDSEIEDISLSSAKTSFAFGEDFSFEDLVVTAQMSDGKEKILDSADYTVTSDDFNCMKVGTYQATVLVNGTDISKTYEVTVEQANKLKVLMIGNSFADDTINYAYEIAKSVGIPEENILIADICIGGCSIATHLANAKSNSPAYLFGLEQDGFYDGTSYTNWTMEQAIEYADWDFITLQQNSANSGIENSYSDLQKLMDYVLGVATDTKNNPNANPNVKLIWHHTWAYAQSSTNAGFSAYDNDQITMYNAINTCLQTQVLDKDFAAIIPNGTAIQNLRTSFIGDNVTRDQSDHLSHDAGRYTASLGLVATLTGRDITTVTWRPTDSGFAYSMSDEMIAACKESVVNAIISPNQVTECTGNIDNRPVSDDVVSRFESGMDLAYVKLYWAEPHSMLIDNSFAHGEDLGSLKVTCLVDGQASNYIILRKVLNGGDFSEYDYISFWIYNAGSAEFVAGTTWTADTVCKVGEWTEVRIAADKFGANGSVSTMGGAKIELSNIVDLPIRIYNADGLMTGDCFYISTVRGVNYPELDDDVEENVATKFDSEGDLGTLSVYWSTEHALSIDTTIKHGNDNGSLKVVAAKGNQDNYIILNTPYNTDFSEYDYISFWVYNAGNADFKMGTTWAADTICKVGEWTEVKITKEMFEAGKVVNMSGTVLTMSDITSLPLRIFGTANLSAGDCFYISSVTAVKNAE